LGVELDLFGYAMGREFAAAVVGAEESEAGVGAVFFNLSRVAVHIYTCAIHMAYIHQYYVASYTVAEPLFMNGLVKFKTKLALSWVGALSFIQSILALS
jgi:hypothetical protein